MLPSADLHLCESILSCAADEAPPRGPSLVNHRISRSTVIRNSNVQESLYSGHLGASDRTCVADFETWPMAPAPGTRGASICVPRLLATDEDIWLGNGPLRIDSILIGFS